MTTKRRKIEILVDKPLLKRIRSIADEVGISGYTIYPTFGGEGGQGRWQDDQVTGGAGSKVLVVSIVDEENADAVLETITPLLDEYGLMLTISNVEVVRANRY